MSSPTEQVIPLEEADVELLKGLRATIGAVYSKCFQEFTGLASTNEKLVFPPSLLKLAEVHASYQTMRTLIDGLDKNKPVLTPDNVIDLQTMHMTLGTDAAKLTQNIIHEFLSAQEAGLIDARSANNARHKIQGKIVNAVNQVKRLGNFLDRKLPKEERWGEAERAIFSRQ